MDDVVMNRLGSTLKFSAASEDARRVFSSNFSAHEFVVSCNQERQAQLFLMREGLSIAPQPASLYGSYPSPKLS
jgi:hypothetical protein